MPKPSKPCGPAIRAFTLSDEVCLVPKLVGAAELIVTVRASAAPKIMESFLTEYGLNTTEGIALICLAEALHDAGLERCEHCVPRWRCGTARSFR